MVAHWPEPEPLERWEEEVVSDFSLVMETIRAIRNARTEKKVPPSNKLPGMIIAGEKVDILSGQSGSIISLAGLDPERLQILPESDRKSEGQPALIVSGIEIYLGTAESVDTGAEQTRLQKELTETETQIERLEALLASPFAQRAPAPVVEKERQKLITYQETASRLREQIRNLG